MKVNGGLLGMWNRKRKKKEIRKHKRGDEYDQIIIMCGNVVKPIIMYN
jgi:hypothetical protein